MCNSISKSPSAVALEIGITKATVNRWKNGGGCTDANLLKIADYFGITVEELKNEQKETPPITDGVTLSAKKQALLAALDRMTDEQCEAVLKLLGE